VVEGDFQELDDALAHQAFGAQKHDPPYIRYLGSQIHDLNPSLVS